MNGRGVDTLHPYDIAIHGVDKHEQAARLAKFIQARFTDPGAPVCAFCQASLADSVIIPLPGDAIPAVFGGIREAARVFPARAVVIDSALYLENRSAMNKMSFEKDASRMLFKTT